MTVGIIFLDSYTAQTWSALTILNKVFSANRDIKRVVELGTGLGGLTLFFGLNMLVRKGKVLTFDIEPVQSIHTQEYFERLNITFEHRSVFEEESIEIARKFIKDERALIFCDNGRKPKEVQVYAEILKKNDLILAHDWGVEITKIDFESKRSDLSKQTLAVLEPYWQEEFDEVNSYILSMRRI